MDSKKNTVGESIAVAATNEKQKLSNDEKLQLLVESIPYVRKTIFYTVKCLYKDKTDITSATVHDFNSGAAIENIEKLLIFYDNLCEKVSNLETEVNCSRNEIGRVFEELKNKTVDTLNREKQELKISKYRLSDCHQKISKLEIQILQAESLLEKYQSSDPILYFIIENFAEIKETIKGLTIFDFLLDPIFDLINQIEEKLNSLGVTNNDVHSELSEQLEEKRKEIISLEKEINILNKEIPLKEAAISELENQLELILRPEQSTYVRLIEDISKLQHFITQVRINLSNCKVRLQMWVNDRKHKRLFNEQDKLKLNLYLVENGNAIYSGIGKIEDVIFSFCRVNYFLRRHGKNKPYLKDFNDFWKESNRCLMELQEKIKIENLRNIKIEEYSYQNFCCNFEELLQKERIIPYR